MSEQAEFWVIVLLSLFVSGSATLLASLVGVPLGCWLGLNRFRFERHIMAIIYTGMGFPPVVVGLIVYLLLSRQGIAGGLEWLFTPAGMILAQFILALPLVAGMSMAAVRNVSPLLQKQLYVLGATKLQIAKTVLLEAKYGIVVAIIAGFGAAISEVGAVMLVGGNIEGRTRVLTTAIVLETRRGNFTLALALGGVLLSLALITNMLAIRWQLQQGEAE